MSIYSTNCQVVAHKKFAAKQYIITLATKKIAHEAVAGQFVHVRCNKLLLMPRPMSIMKINKDNGTIDLLYKIVGYGTKLLSEVKQGDFLAVIGPIGNGFNISSKKHLLLLGGGVGIPPIIAIAQSIRGDKTYKPFAILGSEIPFPFASTTSSYNITYTKADRSMLLLEEWGVVSRLTSMQNYQGVFSGYITDLAKLYLDNTLPHIIDDVEVFACGPDAMLRAVKKLAQSYNIKAQLSLEENMACAVGGCAGCVVAVKDNDDKSMQRVCVDGPVFDARIVFND